MPYINQDKRAALDPSIDLLLNSLRELESDDPSNNTEGNINYVITRILKRVYPGGSYREINDAMGVLTSASHEYYRKVAVPLEDQKEYDNGPVM
jgi:hypothetical protein